MSKTNGITNSGNPNLTREERARECALNSYLLSDFPHRVKSVEYGYLKGYIDCESIKAKEISELQDQLRWRSVEEELPEIDEKVLCEFIAGSMQSKTDNKVSFLKSNGKFHGEMDWVRVTHWLPIPRKEK